MTIDFASHHQSGLAIHLLGRPRLEVHGDAGYRFRSRKSWALLAFLVLAERPQLRSQLAGLLFAEAEDPLRALRWCLAELRRGLGEGATLDGDPVQLALAPGTLLDLDVLVHGHWTEAVALPGLGKELLDGFAIASAEPFEAWLMSERRRFTAASESIVHEAALGLLARGELGRARELAVQATLMSPLDENHQALLIRIYRISGDQLAARRQYDAWAATAERELGAAPGPAVLLALRERPQGNAASATSVDAVSEAGSAAVSAGALTAGLFSLDTAVRMADDSGIESARVETRLALGEALIHSQGGLDETGLATVTEAERIALSSGNLEAVTRARAELGYVDFLRGRYDRSERLLDQVLDCADASGPTRVKALTYLGSVASDRADYDRASELLEEARESAHALGERRAEAYSLSMLGRIGLLRGQLDDADQQLRAAVGLAEQEHWLSFLPWPQALHGHVHLAAGDLAGAAACLEQSHARACQIGDPCWEAISARGLALLQEARGQVDMALTTLIDARVAANRFTDPYVWLDVYILDALCATGLRHGHELTAAWVEEMHDLAARAGMREMVVRAMNHGARLGIRGDAGAAALLASSIANPELGWLLSAPTGVVADDRPWLVPNAGSRLVLAQCEPSSR